MRNKCKLENGYETEISKEIKYNTFIYIDIRKKNSVIILSNLSLCFMYGQFSQPLNNIIVYSKKVYATRYYKNNIIFNRVQA